MRGGTIVALASGRGRAGIAVVRVSGTGVRHAVEAIAGALPAPRRASLRVLREPGGATIDRGLVLYFPGPSSFTGEDVAEFHCHGGRAGVAALIEALLALPDMRAAGPGEFTRRAVENGRLDLTAAEGIADLVEAETGAQRRQALAHAGGALERAASAWRIGLIRLAALVEAEIDFPDEEDVPELLQRIVRDAGSLRGEIVAALAGARRGERLRDGARIVIAGPPNAGKSTLMNALARRDVAIVSDVPGTTRDRIEVHLDLEGYPAVLIDTAGLRETGDRVEGLGVERGLAAAREADFVLWLSPLDAPAMAPDLGAPVETVTTKADLSDSLAQRSGGLVVSAQTGLGIEALTLRMTMAARQALEGGEAALVTRARHRAELETVVGALDRMLAVAAQPGQGPGQDLGRDPGQVPGQSLASSGVGVEFLAEDLRLALRAIGRLTGRVDMDEVFDVIFREFCIGK